MSSRVGPFVTVGALGFALQMTLLAWLVHGCHWSYLVATAVAVEAAVLHNFAWHERWTWRDRAGSLDLRALLARLLRFQIGTGLASIAGNLAVTAAVFELLHLPAIVANVLAVVVTSVANFLVSDRWVFKVPATAALVAVLSALPHAATAAELRRETLAAWNAHVAAVESNLDALRPDGSLNEPEGRSSGVPGGVVHEWRGAVRLRGITVGELVHALEVPGLPPPADDVLDARVLDRRGDDAFRVYMKIARSAIVTVVYDTEHDVTFQRVSSTEAFSRSVATTIREVGGSDRGFLWRLNSYWRYRQDGHDVLVDVVSVSLSRAIPAVARPIAGPIVERIGRESMRRTLDAMQRFGLALRQQAAH